MRGFVLDGRVLDAAGYEGAAKIGDATKFIVELTKAMTLPNTVVVHVGFVVGRGGR